MDNCSCKDNNANLMVSNSCNSCCNIDKNCDNPLIFSPTAGVFQGESLSPFLFSMFLNDINDCMKNDPNVGISIYQFFMILLMFADDMVLVSDNRFGLQRGLDNLHSYCTDWGLEVNVEKTKCMVFKNGGKIGPLDRWTYNGFDIETVNSFKYLGFMFGSSGKFKIGIDNLALRGEKAFFDMTSSIEHFFDMQIKMKLELFDSLVKSVLCYACELWGFSEAKRHDTIYLRFLKHTLCVRKTTPSCFIYKECMVYPLYVIRLLRIIKYWLKIISLDDLSPIKILYNTALELNESENVHTASFWIANVKNTLYKYGFGYVWENQNYANDFDFLNVFKVRLTDTFWQENSSNINELSTNRLYRHLDSGSFTYLYKFQNDFIRIALTKIRLGSHFFMVERGRLKNLDYVDRICFQCNEIEDEYHILICCSKYEELRKKYLPKYLYNKPSMFKFVEFLNGQNEKMLRKLGLYVHHILKIYEKNELFAPN